jgi:hypothetical protein
MFLLRRHPFCAVIIGSVAASFRLTTELTIIPWLPRTNQLRRAVIPTKEGGRLIDIITHSNQHLTCIVFCLPANHQPCVGNQQWLIFSKNDRSSCPHLVLVSTNPACASLEPRSSPRPICMWIGAKSRMPALARASRPYTLSCVGVMQYPGSSRDRHNEQARARMCCLFSCW